ncbi:MAG: phosphoribosylanthranilate isomerase [Fibrobacteria bacterium]
MTMDDRTLKRCQVKVCGIREPAEAAALDGMGVEWIGFNFHPSSPRHISAQAAAPIIRALRHAIPVGVFVDADPDFVINVTTSTGISYVQLHGNENWDYIARMPVPVIKAVPHTRIADLGGLRGQVEAALSGGNASPLAYFMVDTQAGGGFGGSGKAFDWKLLDAQAFPLPYFLAGGLGPQNLADALAACEPFAVDLNSKVESAPGRKDLEKIKACLEIAGR